MVNILFALTGVTGLRVFASVRDYAELTPSLRRGYVEVIQGYPEQIENKWRRFQRYLVKTGCRPESRSNLTNNT